MMTVMMMRIRIIETTAAIAATVPTFEGLADVVTSVIIIKRHTAIHESITNNLIYSPEQVGQI